MCWWYKYLADTCKKDYNFSIKELKETFKVNKELMHSYILLLLLNQIKIFAYTAAIFSELKSLAIPRKSIT